MTFADFIIAPIYFVVLLLFASYYQRKKVKESPEYRWFSKGLLVKMLGAIGFALVYQYYYGGGDTFGYFYGGKSYLAFFAASPGHAWSFLWEAPHGRHYFEFLSYARPGYQYIYRGPAELLITKITSFVNLLSFNTYAGSSLLFAFFSYSGVWALYRTFTSIFKGIDKELAIAVLFLPSVFFWGSGILKDTVSLGALGWLVRGIWLLFIKRQSFFKALFMISLSSILIIGIKPYIILAFIPAALLWIGNQYRNLMPSKFLRMAMIPFFMLIISYSGYRLISGIGDELGKYSVNNLENAAEGFQSWHQVASEGGSGYTLGADVDMSPAGMLRLFPKALSIALFRPFPWEAGSVVILASALENFAILLLTLLVFFKTGPLRTLQKIWSHPFLFSCFIFSIIFGFAVGFTSYNFGALVRYKIPMMPFYVGMLMVLWANRNNAHQLQ